MRSYFRCLEDPDVKPEITTMAEFVYALKQRCQDPALIDRASRTVETLHQGNMRFHDFITLFEDSVADSTYSNLDNSYWMPTLERRLSKSLRTLCNAASDVPTEYHSYITYLRKKDAGIEAIDSSPSFATPTAVKPQINPSMPLMYNAPAPATTAVPSPVHFELPVSQGGSAMDLDSISYQRQSNGRLTQRAKDARRTLGRCVRCNKSGHMAPDCNSASRVIANIALEPQSEEQLKE
ncbi:hypothetical protein K3495_g15277 [Podosphaera aphanis]|nr:hypothetical protein K3495_g15277 [Podosphaera aphanis]